MSEKVINGKKILILFRKENMGNQVVVNYATEGGDGGPVWWPNDTDTYGGTIGSIGK